MGETVLAGNPETGDVKECRILQTFVREVSQVFEAQVGVESIGCSAEHPFWVVDRGWTHANKLQVGDRLTTSAGEVVAIQQVRSRLEKVTVYNFEVEDLHTYFVSDLGILVHNTDCGQPRRILQSRGHTINSSTANGLNEFLGENINRREWGKALEALKADIGLPNDFHSTQILENGDIVLREPFGEYPAGTTVGNLLEYLY